MKRIVLLTLVLAFAAVAALPAALGDNHYGPLSGDPIHNHPWTEAANDNPKLALAINPAYDWYTWDWFQVDDVYQIVAMDCWYVYQHGPHTDWMMTIYGGGNYDEGPDTNNVLWSTFCSTTNYDTGVRWRPGGPDNVYKAEHRNFDTNTTVHPGNHYYNAPLNLGEHTFWCGVEGPPPSAWQQTDDGLVWSVGMDWDGHIFHDGLKMFHVIYGTEGSAVTETSWGAIKSF